jgi:hypothetical protein
VPFSQKEKNCHTIILVNKWHHAIILHNRCIWRQRRLLFRWQVVKYSITVVVKYSITVEEPTFVSTHEKEHLVLIKHSS